jgi:hypothetical protein
MSLSTNTTYRVFVEKLGGTDPADFVGDAGEVFLDPSVPELKLSDGTTAGGVTIGSGGIGTDTSINTTGIITASAFVGDGSGLTNLPGGGGGESYWVSTAAGIHTLSNVGVGTTNPQTKLQVGGVIGFNDSNIRIGDNTTGANLTSGTDNIFMGVGAGNSVTTGKDNNFFGRVAGYDNTTGNHNNFFGVFTGGYNTGSHNNFFGQEAGVYNTGNYNNFFSVYAGYYNTTGSNNNFFGKNAGQYNTTGSNNNFFGVNAGQYNTTGSNNIFFGSWTGASTTASNKIIFGNGFDIDNLFDSPDTDKDIQFAVGVRTDANESKYWLVGNENFNVGIGTTNPRTKLEINGVLGFGTFTGAYGTSTNIRIGDETTGADLTTGSNNIFMGIGAGKSTTSGVFDNFIGHESGKNNTTGSSNNFFGSYSGTSNTDGGYNSFFGNLSGLSNTTGSLNTFVGAASGQNNTSGSYNSFFGDESGYRNTIGNYNSFFGEAAGFRNTTGSNNIFLGAFTGISTSSSSKVLIGFGNNFSNYFDAPDTTKDTQLAIGIRTSSAASKYWLVGDENFNIGINSTAPTAKLDVIGDVRIGIDTSQGVILTDANGVAWRLVVNTDGTLTTASV